MNKINDGGPAFPSGLVRRERQRPHDPGSDFYVSGYTEARERGMTLRDYFAAKALPEVLAQKDVHGHIREWENAAWISYQIADAMLKAREASNG